MLRFIVAFLFSCIISNFTFASETKEQDKELMRKSLVLVGKIQEFLKDNSGSIIDNSGIWVELREFKKYGPNPFYNQTKSGYLILEGSDENNIINALHTPLGRIEIVGTVSGDMGADRKLSEKFLGLDWLRLKLISPAYKTKWGAVGPRYLVMELDGETLLDEELIPAYEGDPWASIFKDTIVNRLTLERALSKEYQEQVLPRVNLLQQFYRKAAVDAYTFDEAMLLYKEVPKS